MDKTGETNNVSPSLKKKFTHRLVQIRVDSDLRSDTIFVIQLYWLIHFQAHSFPAQYALTQSRRQRGERGHAFSP